MATYKNPYNEGRNRGGQTSHANPYASRSKQKNPCFDCFKRDSCGESLDAHGEYLDMDALQNHYPMPTFATRNQGHQCYDGTGYNGYDWRDNHPLWSGFYE